MATVSRSIALRRGALIDINAGSVTVLFTTAADEFAELRLIASAFSPGGFNANCRLFFNGILFYGSITAGTATISMETLVKIPPNTIVRLDLGADGGSGNVYKALGYYNVYGS